MGIKAKVQAQEAGQRVAQVESIQNPKDAKVRIYYMGWSSSTGEADWALRPLLSTEAWPPKLLNVSYYSNARVDQLLKDALNTTDRAKKTACYTEAQKIIWSEAPWAFLATEQNVSGKSKKLSGMYVMPDAGYDYDEIDLHK